METQYLILFQCGCHKRQNVNYDNATDIIPVITGYTKILFNGITIANTIWMGFEPQSFRKLSGYDLTIISHKNYLFY